jgi:hypothetical protein
MTYTTSTKTWIASFAAATVVAVGLMGASTQYLQQTSGQIAQAALAAQSAKLARLAQLPAQAKSVN